MEEQDQESAVHVEILTVDHHLLGYVTTGGRRFSTWLNLSDQRTMGMDNVTLKSLLEVGTPEVSLGFALVNRESIRAVILREAPAGSLTTERDQKPLEYVEKTRHGVVVGLSPYAVRGYVHVAKLADLRRALTTFPDTFMPITEARIVYTPNPKMLWQGEVALINRDRAQLYWPAPDARGDK